MYRTRSVLLPASVVVLFVACALALWRAGDRPVGAVESPELKPAPKPYAVSKSSDVEPDPPDIRVGGFDRPESVPDYEILQADRNEREDARSAMLIVDTRARTGQGLTLIARDIKARYSALDIVSVEFIDSTNFLHYNGGAIIFNTATGAYHAGFVYGPPNNKGYLVQAAD